jgi:hypothetical protein
MTRTAEKNPYLPISMKTYCSRRSSTLLTTLVFTILILPGALPVTAQAQQSTIIGTNVRILANGVHTLMG